MAQTGKSSKSKESEKRSGSEFALDFINLFILLIITLIFFADIILRGQVFFAGDIMNVYSPWQIYNHEALMSGRFPLWTDDFFAGFPLFAESQGALFYPPTRLVYALSPSILNAFSYDVIFHFLLAGWFQYFFARSMKLSPVASLFSAITFAFSGMFLSLPVNFTIFRSIVWIPLIFMFLNMGARKHSMVYPLLAAIALVCQLMGGSIQVTWITGIAMIPFVIFLMLSPGENAKPGVIPFLQLILTLILTAGLYAFQLLPTMELNQHAWRGTVGGWDVVSAYSFHPLHFIEILMPTFYGIWAEGSMIPGLPVSANFFPYIGIIPVILILSFAIVSRKRGSGIFYLLMILGIVLAIGKYGILYRPLYDFVPFFDSFRAPDRFWILSVFAGSMLSGYGIEQIKKWADSEKREQPPFASGTIAVCFMLITLFFIGVMYLPTLQIFWKAIISPITNQFFNPERLGFDPQILENWKIHLATALANFIGFVTLFNFSVALFGKNGRGSMLVGALTVIAVADLFLMSLNVPALKTTAASFFKDPPKTAQVIMRDGEPNRYFTYGREFFAQEIFGHSPDIDPTLWYNGGGSNDISDYVEFREELSPNIHMHWGLTSANGFASLFLRRFHTLEWAADRQLLPLIKNVNQLNLIRENSPGAAIDPTAWSERILLIDLLASRYVVSSVDLGPPERFSLLYDGSMKVYRNRRALPRAWISQPEEILAESDASLNRLYEGKIDPLKTLILDKLPAQPRVFPNGAEPNATASIRLPSGPRGTASRGGSIYDEQVYVSVKSESPAYLVLADTEYPGWLAHIDGQPVEKIYRAYGYFRAIEIPAGDHMVAFKYQPKSFSTGVILSGVTLITIILIMISQLIFFSRQNK